MTGTYIQMTAALIFIILLIFAAAFVMRKKNNGLGLMSVISYQSFGQKKGVAALKIGSEVLILGLSANDMRLLKTFKEDELDLPESNTAHGKFDMLVRSGIRKNEN